MPARARGGKRNPKGRRRQFKRTTVNVNRALNPIPQRYICKMKYCETNVTNAVTGQYLYNLNSLFDPDRTGTGHQPMGFDNMSLLYNRYRVISCSWRIESPITNDSDFRSIHAQPNNDPDITWGNAGYMRESPRTKYVTLNPGGVAKTLTGWISLPSLVGRSRAEYMADDRYQADVLSNPQEAAILYVLSTNMNGNPISVPIQVTLEYTVEFFDVKHLLQSVQ